MTKGRIAAAHGRFNGIHQVAPVCTHPIHPLLGPPTRVQIPNHSSISSAVFAHLTADCHYTLQLAARPSLKIVLPIGDLDPHLIRGSLGMHPSPQPKQHFDQFNPSLHGSDVTDRQTDRSRYSVGNNRPRLRTLVGYIRRPVGLCGCSLIVQKVLKVNNHSGVGSCGVSRKMAALIRFRVTKCESQTTKDKTE